MNHTMCTSRRSYANYLKHLKYFLVSLRLCFIVLYDININIFLNSFVRSVWFVPENQINTNYRPLIEF